MRIFNRVQPVHKAVTRFGAMAHRILRGSTGRGDFAGLFRESGGYLRFSHVGFGLCISRKRRFRQGFRNDLRKFHCTFLRCAKCVHLAINRRCKSLTSLTTMLKFEKKRDSVKFRKDDRTLRCPKYEECLRSLAAERDGTDPAGERSGGSAAGGSPAVGRKRNELRHDEADVGYRGEWTATAHSHPSAPGHGACGTTRARRGVGR